MSDKSYGKRKNRCRERDARTLFQCQLDEGHEGTHVNAHLGQWTIIKPADKEEDDDYEAIYRERLASTQALVDFIARYIPGNTKRGSPQVLSQLLKRYTDAVVASVKANQEIIDTKLST